MTLCGVVSVLLMSFTTYFFLQRYACISVNEHHNRLRTESRRTRFGNMYVPNFARVAYLCTFRHETVPSVCRAECTSEYTIDISSLVMELKCGTQQCRQRSRGPNASSH
jgi:hypothetical protein